MSEPVNKHIEVCTLYEHVFGYKGGSQCIGDDHEPGQVVDTQVLAFKPLPSIRQSVTLLPTALVQLEINKVNIGPFCALLDNGAQPNLISDKIIRSYQLPVGGVTRYVVGIDGQPFEIV